MNNIISKLINSVSLIKKEKKKIIKKMKKQNKEEKLVSRKYVALLDEAIKSIEETNQILEFINHNNYNFNDLKNILFGKLQPGHWVSKNTLMSTLEGFLGYNITLEEFLLVLDSLEYDVKHRYVLKSVIYDESDNYNPSYKLTSKSDVAGE